MSLFDRIRGGPRSKRATPRDSGLLARHTEAVNLEALRLAAELRKNLRRLDESLDSLEDLLHRSEEPKAEDAHNTPEDTA